MSLVYLNSVILSNTTRYQHLVAFLESTGGLEVPPAKVLYRAGFRIVIANPRQTHQFELSKSLTKTDAKDAKMLASYAQMLVLCGEVELHLYTPRHLSKSS